MARNCHPRKSRRQQFYVAAQATRDKRSFNSFSVGKNKIKVCPQWYSKWTVGFNGLAGSSWKVERNSRKRFFCDNCRRIHRHQEPWTIANVFENFSDALEIQEDFLGFYKLNAIVHATKRYPIAVKSFSPKLAGSNLWWCQQHDGEKVWRHYTNKKGSAKSNRHIAMDTYWV